MSKKVQVRLGCYVTMIAKVVCVLECVLMYVRERQKKYMERLEATHTLLEGATIFFVELQIYPHAGCHCVEAQNVKISQSYRSHERSCQKQYCKTIYKMGQMLHSFCSCLVFSNINADLTTNKCEKINHQVWSDRIQTHEIMFMSLLP